MKRKIRSYVEIRSRLSRLESLLEAADKITFVGSGICRAIQGQMDVLEWVLGRDE